MSLILMLLLQFPAVTGQYYSSFVVGDGEEVTLPCDNRRDDLHRCDEIDWIFADPENRPAVLLVKLGQIGEQARTKSDRLSVTKNCSLVIKKVSAKDVGRYTCRQFDKSGQQQGPDSQVYLSVVTMTEREDADEVTLNCSVWTYGPCGHTVKWLFNRTDVDKENHQVKTSQSSCFASLTGPTSHFIYESRFDLLKCEVTDGDKVQFLFSPRPSGEKPGEDTTTTTTTMKPRTTTTTTKPRTTTKPTKTTTTKPRTTTTKPTTTKPTTTKPKTTTTTSSSTTTTTTNDIPTGPPNSSWWLYVLVAVALLALLIIVVKVIRWRRSKGSQTGMKDDVGLTSNPAGTQSAPEPSQDTADPEDGVSYASISYTKKPNRKGRGYEHEAVTYSTVKAAASSSSSASADPSSFYATINKPMQ